MASKASTVMAMRIIAPIRQAAAAAAADRSDRGRIERAPA
jgi:hypothetical protein